MPQAAQQLQFSHSKITEKNHNLTFAQNQDVFIQNCVPIKIDKGILLQTSVK